jgi:hypothetical protein
LKLTKDTRPVKRTVIIMVYKSIKLEPPTELQKLKAILMAELFNALNRPASYTRRKERIKDAG